MKVQVTKDQEDVKGFLGGHKGVKFKISVRAELSEEEINLVERYKLGEYILNTYDVPIGGGQTFTCKLRINDVVQGAENTTEDVSLLLWLEEELVEGCRVLKALLKEMRDLGETKTIEI